MEVSEQIDGHHTAVSPGGRFIACVTTANNKLRVSYAHAAARGTDFTIRIPAKNVSSIKWSRNDNHIALCSAKQIEVINLDDPGHRIRLDNGSGGLGRLASADFVGGAQLLTVWDFGKAKVWDLRTAKAVDLGDLKTIGDGRAWQIRPRGSGNGLQMRPLALLSRQGADDYLTVFFPSAEKAVQTIKIPTVDAQSLSWSPDGRWIAVVDTPSAATSVYFYTPDGHPFRAYPSNPTTDIAGLGIKSLVWSGDSRLIALSKFDGKVVLLNTRTFAPLAMIEHTTTIDQHSLASDQQAPVWQESVSAAHERSYALSPQPVSPPLSKARPSAEPNELGVAEACFNHDGSLLATRDERMLNTVWLWSMATWTAHAVILQHSNVRRMNWHPHHPDILLLDCGEGIAYLFDTSIETGPPIPVAVEAMAGTPFLSWLPSQPGTKSAILAATRSAFRILYPDGADKESLGGSSVARPTSTVRPESPVFDEGASDDSLFALLSGRKPVPDKTEPSYTEMIDLETEAADEEDESLRLDDTFREKRKARDEPMIDPLDDSQIF